MGTAPYLVILDNPDSIKRFLGLRVAASLAAERRSSSAVTDTVFRIFYQLRTMPKTVEVVVDEDGSIQLPASITLKKDQRVLVTILDEGDGSEQDSETEPSPGETAVLSEEALAKDWTRDEEEEAWKHLQPDQ